MCEWEWVDSRRLTREEELFKRFFENLPTDGDWTVVQAPDAPGLEVQSGASRRTTWLARVDAVIGNIIIPTEAEIKTIEAEIISQIKKDVDRSSPEFPVLNFRTRLELLLKRYAVRNPTVGYCQGLSFVATALLQEEFSDREAFRVFVFLVEQLVSDFHVPSLSGLHQAVAQTHKSLTKLHPEILAQIEANEIPLLWLAVEPLMTLWSRKFPLFAIRLIWNFFLTSDVASRVGRDSSLVVALFVAMLIACKDELSSGGKNMEIVVAVHKRMQMIASDVKALASVINASRKILDSLTE